MPRKLNDWSHQHVTDFLKENGFSFFEELKGSRQAWIKLQDGGEPDRIVEISFRQDIYSERTMKARLAIASPFKEVPRFLKENLKKAR